ncbi:toxin TcdB middle/N-terminal domain-containing protein [Candidatus Omnitrophota bacterium]
MSFGSGQTPVISDFNSDGLTDIGIFTKGTGQWQAYCSDGDGFVSSGTWLNSFGQGEYNTVYALDFNGDGLTDAAAFDNQAFTWARLAAQGQVADLLQKITNSLGGSTEITYKSSVSYDNTGDDSECDLPFALQTVSAVTHSDGLGNAYYTFYSYADGLYSSSERETRGFGYVEVKDNEENISETYFYQDDIYKGLPYLTRILNRNGMLFAETAKTYDYSVPYSGCTFAYLVEEIASNYDGYIIPKATKAIYEYDDYGNPTKLTSLGDVDIIGDERVQHTEYTYNTSSWIVDRPTHVWLIGIDSQNVSESWYYYDTTGNLMKEEVWLDTTAGRLETSYTYDIYGNVETTTDARENTTTTTYEETYHTYPLTIRNVSGHTLQYTYDPKTGQILSTTDPNDQTTTNKYDVFGRLDKVFGPNDDSSHPATWYEYQISPSPAKITSYVREEHNTDNPDKIRTSLSFVDGLGRTIQTKTEAEDHSKQIVSGTVVFNSRGEVKQKYLPYLTDKTSEYTAPDLSGPRASFEYDGLGRTVKTINPDSTYRTIQYAPNMVTVTDENDHQTKKYNDAYGQTTRIEEFNQGQTYVTRYAYDSQGNLLETIDDQNNTTNIAYDSLGRKTSMDDPDMGHWEYEYDQNGNLIKQTDAKDQILEFSYDSLNRLTGKQADGQTIVSYSYDDTSKPNCKGRLSKVTDQSGSTEFFYDNLGREIKTTKTIDSNPYTVQRTYDALNRLISVTYPNGKTAQYTYNRQGGIETVSTPEGSVTNIDYSTSSQMKLIQYSNGTETHYDYNPYTLRLSDLETTSPTATLQDLAYDFDNVGNVYTIIDNSPEGTNTQSFQYDHLSRLISANGSYGTINYQYDSIGNMLQKGDLEMEYGQGAGPHAVTSLRAAEGGEAISIAYDSNGNMLTKGQSTYTYDTENRLTQVVIARPPEAAEAISISIELTPGWNFISIPLELTDYSITNVLSSIAGKYDQVTRYNSTTGQFESFVNNSTYDQFSTFSFGEGYLIHASESCTLTLTGQRTVPQARDIRMGWNLIASPALEGEILTAEALNNLIPGTDYSKITEYDGTSYTDNPASLKPGKAYYIHALQDCIWQIPVPEETQTTEFVYDGDGGRVMKKWGQKLGTVPEGDCPNFSIYIGSLYEEDSEGNSKCHIYLGSNKAFTLNSPTSEPTNTTTYYYHTDHLGSSNVISDDQGNIAQLLEYKPYGLTNREEGSYNNNYRFTGQLFDSTSNLYYYGARYYDPEIGRFTQPDTIVQAPYDPQSFNRYAYCRNNPINYVDPTGHGIWDTFKKWAGKIVGAVVGVVATIVSGGNAALGFAAFNCADAMISGGQALAAGANPAQVLGAVGLGIALNSAIPFPNFANLGMQIGAAAVRGAAISTATQAAIQGGKGKYGPTAAWGAGMGATTGFLSSQQFQNWQAGKGFLSNKQAIVQQKANANIQQTLDSAFKQVGITGRMQTASEMGIVAASTNQNAIQLASILAHDDSYHFWSDVIGGGGGRAIPPADIGPFGMNASNVTHAPAIDLDITSNCILPPLPDYGPSIPKIKTEGPVNIFSTEYIYNPHFMQ